jgi:GNAT superfamily N-acetyltransferase
VIVIRRAAAEDLEAVLALYRQLIPDDPPLPPADAAAPWAEMMADDHHHVLVGEVGGRVVTSCTLVIVRNLTRGARPFGLVENVVTDAGHRRQGHGLAIVRHALGCAWDARCYKVMLLTGSRREETLRFYEKAGFRRGIKTGFVASPPGS